MAVEPTTTAALIMAGGNALSSFLGGRDKKKDLAAEQRQAAMNNLLKSLSSRPAQQSMRNQMQDSRGTGILQTLAGYENLQKLLAQQLEKGSGLRKLLGSVFKRGTPPLSLSGSGNTAQGPGGYLA